MALTCLSWRPAARFWPIPRRCTSPPPFPIMPVTRSGPVRTCSPPKSRAAVARATKTATCTCPKPPASAFTPTKTPSVPRSPTMPDCMFLLAKNILGGALKTRRVCNLGGQSPPAPGDAEGSAKHSGAPPMKLTKLHLWHLPLTSHEAYYMADGKTCDTVETVVIAVETDTGLTGWGEVCPIPQ